MTAERTKAIKELEYVKKQTGYADIVSRRFYEGVSI